MVEKLTVRFDCAEAIYRRDRPIGPVGPTVPSNFGDHWDQEYLVPSNFCNWLSFFSLLQVCCCEPGGWEISVDCCSSGARLANLHVIANVIVNGS